MRVAPDGADPEAFAGLMGMNPHDVTVMDGAGNPVYTLQRRNQHSVNGWIVLPGQTLVTDASVYVMSTRGAPALALDSLGRAGATLRISEWTKRSTFPVNVAGPVH